MKKAIIIVLVIAQANCMSFYDVFAPVEDSLGRLVSDVVTDIKDTIDCTILAVEHVFSLGGIFGGGSEYDEKCKGQNEDSAPQNDETYPPDYDTQETPNEYPPTRTTQKKIITQEVEESVSDASQRIQNIIDHSNAHITIENVKNSIKNETERLIQISALLRREIEKLPDEVRKKFNFKYDQPSIEDLFEEVKMLYNVEQRDKSSAEANEVRRVFDKVLDILLVNNTDSYMSDEEEVKLILSHLGKSSNDSLIDVEKKVSQWTEEEKREITDIKHVVIITNNVTQSGLEHFDDKNKTDENIILAEKLDEIETQQARMVEFSNSLKNLTKSILDKVSVIESSHDSIVQYTTEAPISEDVPDLEKLSALKEKLLRSTTESNNISTQPIISTELPHHTTESSIESQFNKIGSLVSSIESMRNSDLTINSTTMNLSTSAETISISIKSSQSDTESEEFEKLPSNLTDSPSPINTVTDNSDANVLATTLPMELSTTQLAPIIARKQITPLPTVTNFSSSKIQTTQMSSATVQTLQSNIQTVATATLPPQLNTQASLIMSPRLDGSKFASPNIYPSRFKVHDSHNLASVPGFMQTQSYASVSHLSQLPIQTSIPNEPRVPLLQSRNNPSMTHLVLNAKDNMAQLSALAAQGALTNPFQSISSKYVQTYPKNGRPSQTGAEMHPNGKRGSKVETTQPHGRPASFEPQKYASKGQYSPLGSQTYNLKAPRPLIGLSAPKAKTSPLMATPFSSVLGPRRNPSKEWTSRAHGYPSNRYPSPPSAQSFSTMVHPITLGAQKYSSMLRPSPRKPQTYSSKIPFSQQSMQTYRSMERSPTETRTYPSKRQFTPPPEAPMFSTKGRPSAAGAQHYSPSPVAQTYPMKPFPQKTNPSAAQLPSQLNNPYPSPVPAPPYLSNVPRQWPSTQNNHPAKSAYRSAPNAPRYPRTLSPLPTRIWPRPSM